MALVAAQYWHCFPVYFWFQHILAALQFKDFLGTHESIAAGRPREEE